ncbi:MAG: hypothetical protein ACYTET_04380 [Planctomycetota bacterium]|jgi:hypothetical protein
MLAQLNILFLQVLSPTQRYDAMRRLDGSGGGNNDLISILTNKWFVLLGWSMIVVLLLLLFAVRRMRLERQSRETDKRYEDNANRLKLTAEERDIVEAIAVRAPIKQKDSIFTLQNAFEEGLAKLMQEVFTSGHDLVERKKLHAVIFSIKEKLGFVRRGTKNVLNNRSSKEYSSRQIPAETVLTISLLQSGPDAKVSAEVIQNDDFELLLRPEIPIYCKPGDIWRVQYQKAAMTWEFEAITMACSDKGLALNHSDRIRFINRRRFTRVATRKPAQIALFPIFRSLPDSKRMHLLFSSAELTEIAGPGLRIKTDLAVSIRQRVAVIFELEPGKLVQDVGEVRDIRESGVSRTIIVELIGLNNKAVDELVRVTNQIASQSSQLDQPANTVQNDAVEVNV